MSQERVVITGMSAVTPTGIGLFNFWDNCIKGVSGVQQINLFPIPDEMSQVAGIANNFKPDSLGINDKINTLDRCLLFSEYAIEESLKDARLASPLGNPRYGIYLSSAVAQITAMERIFNHETQSGTKELELDKTINGKNSYNPFLFSSITGELAKRFGFPSHMLIPTGCAGGIDAITYAVHAIRNNKYDVIVTGATEAPITPLVVSAFSKIGATSRKWNKQPTKASRPFDKGRDGFVLGEGCGILVLESLKHAQKRGAKIYAEITGVGSINNHKHMTDIPQDGVSIARSCVLAIQDANISPDKIDFINAHGSSTPQNDIAETKAFHHIFKERANKIPVTSIKSQIGHSLSASNAIETITAVMSINTSIIPPTINLDQKDDLCDLDVVGNIARQLPVNCILKTSSGFSGIHSSLIIEHFVENRYAK
ncbi:MAG: beta-ketoacyl synthase [Gammaproteobacteria bacterium]|jgi:3-oxoacyl-(acyl-carrier-protein) synthase|nr:beta-ketoacyl synthase [Gammaproteobacteria bacterium]